MARLLQVLLWIGLSSLTTTAIAQDHNHLHHSGNNHEHNHEIETGESEADLIVSYFDHSVFMISPSFFLNENGFNHSHGLGLIDFLSADEGSDFNCSGGFCLNKSHYHKKGITLKRQLFSYFVEISC